MGRKNHRWIEGLTALEHLYLDISDVETQLKRKLEKMNNLPKETKDKLMKEITLMLNTTRYLLRYTRSKYSESLSDSYTDRYEMDKGLKLLIYFVNRTLEEHDNSLTDGDIKHTLKRTRILNQKSMLDYYMNLLREGRAVRNLR